jgi:iron complex transport system substrate-binding protein
MNLFRRTTLLVLAALAATMLAALPAQAAKKPKIVAIDTYTAETAVAIGAKPAAVIKFKEIPPLLKGVPTIDVSHSALDFERLVALKPDWVATSPDWSQFTPQIKQLGFPVKSYNPQTYRSLLSVTLKYGKDLGYPGSARRLVDSWKRGVDRQSKLARKNKPQRVIMIFGAPTGALLAFLPSSYAGTMAKTMGAKLIADGLNPSPSVPGFASISKELVVAQNPDVIVLVPHGSPADKQKTIDTFRNDPAWANTNAVKNGKLIIDSTDRLYTPGPRVVSLANSMRRWFGK